MKTIKPLFINHLKTKTMNNLILKTKLALAVILFTFITSCSSDDDNATAVQTPSVSYTTTTLDAVFFQVGNSDAPTINWNGNQGSFSLATPITGLSINSTTGVLNWTNSLPMGIHNIQAIATNSAGQTTVNITINNPLQGIFTGTYDNASFFEIEFNTDGTMLIRANDETNPTTATGTWSVNGSNILADYTYDTNDEYSLTGLITQGATTAIYEGDWFSGHGSIAGNEGGVFEMIMD